MNTYKLNFIHNYINCDKVKENDLNSLKTLINGARIRQKIQFNCYCSVSFDETDKLHAHPIVTELETYARNKTCGIIYDVASSDTNPDKYNRVFIYSDNAKNDGFYGFVLFHTDKLENQCHVFNLAHEKCALVIKLAHCIDNIKHNMELTARLLAKKKEKEEFEQRKNKNTTTTFF